MVKRHNPEHMKLSAAKRKRPPRRSPAQREWEAAKRAHPIPATGPKAIERFWKDRGW